VYRGFVLDLDGTVYLGERLIPGADRAIARLRAAGRRVVFVSNKPLASVREYADKLSSLGVPVAADDVINSAGVTATYLSAQTPGAAAIVIGERALVNELEAAGIRVVDDANAARWVVLSFDREFDYGKLRLAFEAIRAGAEPIATNPDRTCPFDGYELPDCAAVIGAVEGCTGRKVELVAGKPSPIMISAAATRLGIGIDECLVVGDRLETDVAMARAAGTDSALVLTGVAKHPAAIAAAAPTYVLNSIAGLEAFA
jgi:HAD superfamily hydrolase (TIGR01450 family)